MFKEARKKISKKNRSVTIKFCFKLGIELTVAVSIFLSYRIKIGTDKNFLTRIFGVFFLEMVPEIHDILFGNTFF